MDLYSILGIRRNASAEEVKTAARTRQKETHPDTGGSAEEFQKVQNAVRVLSDPEKRDHYDRTGEEPPRERSEEDRIEHEASLVLARYVTEALSGDARYTNIPDIVIKRAMAAMTEHRNQLEDKRAEVAAAVKTADEFMKRFKKMPKDDRIGSIIRAQLNHVEQESAKVEAIFKYQERC